ncbi:hypothetical protein MOF23_07650 [Bacillus inaquosorum]|uniref:hypothetical protein n=1 Tax=Bacillus inaquosorum TaxID=483913 RepID=UPI002281EBD1|nr:hypothetical protein [Bacillus inaquosorum]MCY9308843.1 hypothetical protein [Bacillus inaquosorum]
MNAKQIYDMEPREISNELSLLAGFYYNHLPEIEDIPYGLEQDKVSIKIYADYEYDWSRFWRLASVWFEDIPVMIIQNAGRDGDDHRERFITDEKAYENLVSYVKGLIPKEEVNNPDLIDLEEDITGLSEFYGWSLEQLYDPNFNPPYKIGDIVEANVSSKLERYFFSDTLYEKRRVKITNVDPLNPTATYKGYELDRIVDREKLPAKLLNKPYENYSSARIVTLDSKLKQVK